MTVRVDNRKRYDLSVYELAHAYTEATQVKWNGILGDMYAQWEIIPDLKFKTSIGVDIMYHKSDRYTPSNIYQSGGLAEATIANNRSVNWLNENILTWNKEFGDIHNLSVLGGFTMQQNNTEYVSASSKGFVNDILLYNNLGAGSIYNKPESNATQWNLMSYLARINYSLYNRYLFSLNGRVDGSSRFGASNKYGFFPSASAAWRISEEGFMESLRDKISNLKLRTSFGYTGNTEIGVYESLATMGSNSWTIGNQLVTGFFPNRIPNPDLKWERTAQFDVGLDVGLFNNRLRITTDYYYKKTEDCSIFSDRYLEAVHTIVDTFITEQRHENSPYRFVRPEEMKGYTYGTEALPDCGKGLPVNYTGMTWSGFRPSDDPCRFGYLIPANMFAAVILGYICEIADEI